MTIKVRDVVSFSGRDYIVEATATYRLGGRTSVWARAVDGAKVVWVESPTADAAHGADARASGEAHGETFDRLLVLHDVADLDISLPPPSHLLYHRLTYVQRVAGRATIDVTGSAPERPPGTALVWRYRATGDLYVQIEDSGGRVRTLAGESIHRGMIDILPGH